MARGINKVILVGNLGSDPEVRYMPNGNPVATLSLATSETWKDKTTGEKQERTEWHRVVCFNKLGEIVSAYAKKGAKLYIEGSLRTRKWQDQQGQDRYTTEIVATDMQLLDSRGAQGNEGYGMNARPQSTNSAAPMRSDLPADSGQFAPVSSFEDLNDDVPF